jgi:Leucine-rich repeat (LRR) protein
MSWNVIRGQLPIQIGNLSMLKKLDLSCNVLTGKMSDQMFKNLTSLQVLDLSFNQFYDPIPNKTFEDLNLTELNLSGNKFSGSIPKSITSLVKLKVLKLYSNNFCGEILSMSKLKEIEYVNMSQNNFSRLGFEVKFRVKSN